MATVIVNERNELILPADLVSEWGLAPGTELEVQATRGGLWLRLARHAPDQWWYWTPEFQKAEAELASEIEAGLSQSPIYTSTEEFLTSLEARPSVAAVG